MTSMTTPSVTPQATTPPPITSQAITSQAITSQDRLGDIITARPSLARELERRGLDYCCGGSVTLAEACADNGLDPETVAAELDSFAADDSPADWSTMSVTELVDHIEEVHHQYLWDEMPRLSELFAKVVTVHGENHPELSSSCAVYESIRADLEPHLDSEEQRVFPMVRELAAAAPTSAARMSMEQPLSVLLSEHDTVGDLLLELRSQTDGYTPPADACASYTALFAGLVALEHDTHLHIHKENNILFPAVLALEHQTSS